MTPLARHGGGFIFGGSFLFVGIRGFGFVGQCFRYFVHACGKLKKICPAHFHGDDHGGGGGWVRVPSQKPRNGFWHEWLEIFGEPWTPASYLGEEVIRHLEKAILSTTSQGDVEECRHMADGTNEAQKFILAYHTAWGRQW